jgi:hypothetical protein
MYEEHQALQTYHRNPSLRVPVFYLRDEPVLAVRVTYSVSDINPASSLGSGLLLKELTIVLFL